MRAGKVVQCQVPHDLLSWHSMSGADVSFWHKKFLLLPSSTADRNENLAQSCSLQYNAPVVAHDSLTHWVPFIHGVSCYNLCSVKIPQRLKTQFTLMRASLLRRLFDALFPLMWEDLYLSECICSTTCLCIQWLLCLFSANQLFR